MIQSGWVVQLMVSWWLDTTAT